MKKIILLSLVLMIGLLSRANNFNNKYLSSQSVSFVAAEVYFEVFLDGSFTFTLPFNYDVNYRGQRSRSGQGGRTDNMSLHYSNTRNVGPQFLKVDHSGVLYAIGETSIVYNSAGQVKSIGAVQLNYSEGKLSQIGSMNIHYQENDTVSHTYGSINYTSTRNAIRGVKSSAETNTKSRRNRQSNQLRYTGLGVKNANDFTDWYLE